MINRERKRIYSILLIYFFLQSMIQSVNYVSYNAYKQSGFRTIVPMDSLIFMIMGLVFLGISCFSFLQLSQYRIGKLFACYAFLLALAVSLSPCKGLHDNLITTVCTMCTYVSSILLFQVIGSMILMTQSRIFRIARGFLFFFGLIGMTIKIISLFPHDNIWIYLVATDGTKAAVMFSVILSVGIVLVKQNSSNPYAKKQAVVLTAGIVVGGMLFLLATVVPNIYVVQPQNPMMETEQIVELTMNPSETIMTAFPLLLFSGITIAVIVMLLKREFALQYSWLQFRYFIVIPIFLFIPNVLLCAFTNSSLWIQVIMNLFLSVVPMIQICLMSNMSVGSEEQIYQWRLMNEVEKEKQVLSAYLHDDILQSLIICYRQIQIEKSERYVDVKEMLSQMISEIRNVSHNLYPTIVEDLGLEQSLHVFIGEFQNKYPDICFNFQYEFCEGILPGYFMVTIYRTVRELITNAVKHANATEIDCCLTEDENGYYLHIQDNGKGFYLPENEELLQSPHMGLYTVKKQIRSLQGKISFQSSEQTGTEYHIYFSKEELSYEA